MDPSGPAQPPLNAAYQVEGNAAESNPAEQRAAAQHRTQGDSVQERRTPENQPLGVEDATFSSLGHGKRGALAGEEQRDLTEAQVGRHRELEGEQMRAPGEGDVAAAVRSKPGATGTQPDLASDLDRKKREQASAREAMKSDRQAGMLDDGNVRGGVDVQ